MRSQTLWILGVAMVALCCSGPAFAGLPCSCERLDSEARERAEALMAKIHPHDCCDDNLWTCLHGASPSRLVTRLGAVLCRRVGERESDADILREFERRAASMLGTGSKAKIDTSKVAWAGDSKAPVEIVVYTCARCPFCSKSVPAMSGAVTDGMLKGKARLGLRLFPVKGHPHSAEGGIAFEAALRLGKFWPFVLEVYRRFNSFSVEKLPAWAGTVGIDQGEFEDVMQDPSTRRAVVASKKEGLRNQVGATPTYFINGKLYRADMADWALSDAVLEEHDRITGDLCKPE